jgi:hypothetical protein
MYCRLFSLLDSWARCVLTSEVCYNDMSGVWGPFAVLPLKRRVKKLFFLSTVKVTLAVFVTAPAFDFTAISTARFSVPGFRNASSRLSCSLWAQVYRPKGLLVFATVAREYVRVF